MARDFGLRRLLSDRGAGRAALFQNRGQPVHRARDALAARARLSADAGSVDVMSFAEVIGDPIKHSKSPLIHSFRSEEHTSELQSLMRISYAVFCLKKKKINKIKLSKKTTKPTNKTTNNKHKIPKTETAQR